LSALGLRYQSEVASRVAAEFGVTPDALKAWAKQHHLTRKQTCAVCGREFEPGSSRSTVCALCSIRLGDAWAASKTR